MNRTPWHRDGTRAESITHARTGLSQDVRGRQRRYIAAMGLRSACVIVMAATWSRWPVLAVCALVAGVVIPYVAVVAAQAGWSQQRGARPALARVREEPISRVLLEPTLILPPERNAAG
ncbi:hypothetical protein KPP03845_300042 (plasmid) [Streptomyces xanthophaeus]|uniref:DUF3099 domain-containing protein n=1 Tax=Streptomyces xanthophaeus TaxID=67385 RepID=UPI00233F3C19|nr:DUF3099 domain-containing protein [Streptomyces xanthophaeus]WCD91387.1 hypothetical protein KPP03845_300042 [Streptomyces xanthophaeus]